MKGSTNVGRVTQTQQRSNINVNNNANNNANNIYGHGINKRGKQHQHEQHKREVTPPMCKNNVKKTKTKLKKQKQNQCKKNTIKRKDNYKER